MSYSLGDSAVGYKFVVTIDGVQCPLVTEVSGPVLEVEKIESKTQNNNTKEMMISHMPGPRKPGEITVTRQLTQDKTISSWLQQVMGGDITGSRKTAKIEILDFQNSPVKTYEFQNVWCTKVETSAFKAGSNEAMTEKFTLTWTDWTIS